ncbi:MAG: glycoside hydrolase domain-containing protein [Eubacterium sp.]|uniref:glycoside hydrolase domain-containing protein n=1 Tax=Eubacterium sp. TaxID=142586 RepID=UPI0039925CDB
MDGVGGIHEQREAREVKLGQYGHSNQPSHHIPYMYLYSSRPWETQKYVRDILARCYAGSTFGQGYIGDEDNGEMSAWYILSSIGFYPLSMGNDEFAIGSPQFKEVTVNLEGNKKLVIKANNNSRENVYVDSMYVNGEKYDKTFIKYKDLIKGGTIEFNMSSTPNKERGLEQDSLTSITTDDNKPQVYTDYSKDANKSSSTGVTTLDNLFDDNSDTETKVDNTTTLMFKFTDKKAVRMLTLTSSKSGRTPDRAKVYGANEDDNWVLLGDYHDSGSLFFNIWGKYTRPFGISADKVGKYSRYKVVLTGTDAYLSEVEMLGYKNNGILKSDLKNAIDVAKSIDTTGEYLPIAKRLENNLKEASSVYANEEASDDEILKAYQSLGRIVDIEKKTIKIHDASQVEAEEFDAKSGHIVNDGKNIGGVENNTWVRYDSVYFNGSASQVSFNYSGQKSDAGGYAQVYIDSKVGEPVATINLPVTGDHWSTYTTVSQQLEKSISGLHNVYIVFKNDGSHKYVANVDNIAFDVKRVGEKDNIPSGYTEATVNQWTPSGKWECYFGNLSGTASGSYKWASDADYNIYVDKANKGKAWSVQGSYTDNVTSGHTYKVTVDVTASKACSIGIKEDLSNKKDPQVYTDIPANGTRTLTGTYTVTNNQIKVMFELGQNVDAGTNINFKNIKIEDTTASTTKESTTPTAAAPTTVAPTTEVPTTVAPTTGGPTTVAPTTEAPATIAPTTVAPTTVAPTTEAPTIETPTIVAPTTEAPTTMAPTIQSKTSTEAIGEGSDVGKVNRKILNCKNDKDLAGSTFGKLCVRVKKSKKKAISLTWKKIQVAKTYVIYGAKCGTSYKKIATVHRKTFTNKKLKKGTYYKYMVVALNEKGKVVAISKLIHVATTGGKVGNCKKLKVNKSKVNLKQGRKFKLKVKQIAKSKKVKLKKHRKTAFESDNQDVAVVSKKGVITAKKKGKCSVYVYAQNGVYKRVKVTVK